MRAASSLKAGVAAARACVHTPSQPAAGRSQPRSKAGQSSALRSASQPGNSAQRTGTQRERPRTTAGPSGAGAASGIGALVSGAAGGSGGGLEQASSEPRIATHSAPAALRKTFDMWLILLEALGALALLLLIVWWTMFSGRNKGERREDD